MSIANQLTPNHSPQIITGTIIAGPEDNEQSFQVRKELLEISPIIKGWIEEPDSMPLSIRKNDCLYFKGCDPNVVRALIQYLEMEELSFKSGCLIDGALGTAQLDPIFYVRIYKLALVLA